MPGAGKWSVLLALEQDTAGVWRGSALTAEHKHRPSQRCDWTYASTTGLMQSKTDAEDNE